MVTVTKVTPVRQVCWDAGLSSRTEHDENGFTSMLRTLSARLAVQRRPYYDDRNTSMGSVRMAFHAGIKLAISDTTIRNSDARLMVMGSAALTP